MGITCRDCARRRVGAERTARDPEQAREIVQQALNELRHAMQIGEIAPGRYREIKARFDQVNQWKKDENVY